MKRNIFTALLVLIIAMLMLPGVVLGADSFTVGPAALDIQLDEDGNGTTSVYVSSTFDGELVVGVEGIPVKVEPEKIKVTSNDQSRKVDLVLRGDKSFEEKPYSGKLTFLAYTGDNVAYGVKIKANVTMQPAEPEEEEPSKSRITDAFRSNTLIIVLIVLVIVALAAGILIGRKRRV